MLYTRTTFPQICVFISGDRQIFGVFTVLFMKLGYLEDSNAAAHSVDTGIS